MGIQCLERFCLEECACSITEQSCKNCMQKSCKMAFNKCAWGTPQSPPELPDCGLSPKCQMGLKAQRACFKIVPNGGRSCYQGLKVWKTSLSKFGCPNLDDTNSGILSKAACWCGEDKGA